MKRTTRGKRNTTESNKEVPPERQKLDDRTAIDDAREKSESLPKGFGKRLPAGVKRTVKVDREQLRKNKGKPFLVYENGKLVAKSDKIRIEGDSDMVKTKSNGLGCGSNSSAHLETESSILVG